MSNRHNLTQNRTKISGDRDHNNVIQNISNSPLRWTEDEDSNDYYSLMPGDFLKVNYDIWVKSDTLKTPYLVTGTFLAKHPPLSGIIYRKNVVKNKTYVYNKAAVSNLTTTLAVLTEALQLTIQKDKNIKISIRIPFIGTAVGADINVQLGIKVNNVDHLLSDSDKVLCDSSTVRESQAYIKTIVLDPIFLNFVAGSDADYTIRVKLSAKTSTSSARVSSTVGVNNSAVSSFGTLLPSARNQNHMSIIVEEFDR